MDVQTLALIATGIVTVASALTNLIPTPAPTAPTWQRILYRGLEAAALVFGGAKENPAAVKAITDTVKALENKAYPTAAVSAVDAYEQLTGRGLCLPGIRPALTAATAPTTLGVAVATAIGVCGLSACTSTGALTPATAQALAVACQVDAALQPVLVTLAPAVAAVVAPIAASDTALVHPGVVAACAALAANSRPVAVVPAVSAVPPP